MEVSKRTLLERAISHAKQQPRLQDRRSAAVFYVKCEYQAAKKVHNYTRAIVCRLLLKEMDKASTLASLLETYMQEEAATEPDQLPSSCNTGVTFPADSQVCVTELPAKPTASIERDGTAGRAIYSDAGVDPLLVDYLSSVFHI